MTDPFDAVREYIDDEAQEPRAGATPDDLAAAVNALGFDLPPLLVRLYTEIGDGGFGPGYELFPLLGKGGVTETYAAESSGEHWPTGVVPLLDWGCGMYAAVDTTHPDAQVLLFEPNVYDGDWAAAWFVDRPSLGEWLASWTSPTTWFNAAEMGEEPEEMVLWRSAESRLTGQSTDDVG